MKLPGVIMLILALLGIGYFLHGGGCDGSVLLGDSGPNIPPGDGLEWIDLTVGNGPDSWVLVTDNPEFEQAEYSIDPINGVYVCPIVSDDNFVTFSDDQIRWGFRFGVMVTLSEDEKNTLRSVARTIKLYPLLETSNYMGYKGPAYYLDTDNGLGLSTGSDIRSDRDYIYVEINNIPDSPTNKYALAFGDVDVGQEILYRKGYVIILKRQK